MDIGNLLVFGVAKKHAGEYRDLLGKLDERWIDGNDSPAANHHFNIHSIHGRTKNGRSNDDYIIHSASGFPRSNGRSSRGFFEFYFPIDDKEAYIKAAEAVANTKVDGRRCNGFTANVGDSIRFDKYKQIRSDPPMYYAVSYKRDNITGEPLIVAFFVADRFALEDNFLNHRTGDLPKEEITVDLSKYKQPTGKVYYQEYTDDGKTAVDKEKDFDTWSEARKYFADNKFVSKAEKYDIDGNLVPGATLMRTKKNKDGANNVSSGVVCEETRKQTAVKSNGVYSVLNDEWIKEPVAEDIPEIDDASFERLFNEWKDRYFEILRAPTKDSIEAFMTDVYDLRKSSIADEGEYGLGNLVFKELRSLGYLDNLRDVKREISDKELSLEGLRKGSNKGASKKLKYAYDGPIFRFDRYIKSAHIETLATSLAQAVNNIKFKACSMIGYDRSAGANVDINSDNVHIVEDDDASTKQIQLPTMTKLCPKCGIVHLNDAGECPLCDLGDASVLDDENSL